MAFLWGKIWSWEIERLREMAMEQKSKAYCASCFAEKGTMAARFNYVPNEAKDYREERGAHMLREAGMA